MKKLVIIFILLTFTTTTLFATVRVRRYPSDTSVEVITPTDDVTSLASTCTDEQVLGGDGAGGLECQTDATGGTETDPTLTDDNAVTIGSGSGDTKLTFDGGGTFDPYIEQISTNNQWRFVIDDTQGIPTPISNDDWVFIDTEATNSNAVLSLIGGSSSGRSTIRFGNESDPREGYIEYINKVGEDELSFFSDDQAFSFFKGSNDGVSIADGNTDINPSPTAQLDVRSGDASRVVLNLQHETSSTADSIKIEQDDGTDIARVDVDGHNFIKENSAANADVAGFGQFWVKNETPNVPYFTDDAGTDFNLLSVPSGTNPTTDASGEIAHDTDDNALEIYDGSNSRLIPSTQFAHISIYDPDTIQAVEDAVPVLMVETEWAPHGITLLDLFIKTDASSTYSVNFEEWTSPTDGTPSTIETVATSTSTEASDDGTLTDSAIAAGSIIYVDLPATDIDMLQVGMTYYINEGD